MKKIIVLVLVFGLFSCQKKEEKVEEEKSTSVKEKKLEMYEMSEMATLMEQMYVDNKRLKERILKGDTIGTFPEHFLKIFTAKFTDETENDLFFKQKAKDYITAQQLIYSDPKNAKEHFNAGVDACIKCHESKCGGPIPRIKKLYIK
jgi:cytochrome c553